MGTVITTSCYKGGVGKSTITSYIAMELAEQGNKVCVLDLCQNASISTAFLRNRDEFELSAYDWLTGEATPSEVIHKVNENLYFIPSDERIDDFEDYINKKISETKRLIFVKEKVSNLKKYFDYVLIDTHPSENAPLVTFALVGSDYALVPFEVDEDSRLAVNRTIELIDELIEDKYLIDYFVIGNKIDNTKQNMVSNYKKLKEKFISDGIKEESFISYIRATTLIPSTKFEKRFLYEKKHNNKYAKSVLSDFQNATNDILNGIRKEK